VRTAAIFPGQLSARVGMGQELAARSPAAAAVLERGERVCGKSFGQLLFHGPAAELALHRNAQAAVLVVGTMAWAALVEAGLQVQALAGYSLGVFPALAAAGSISLEDALALVLHTADLYDRMLDGLDAAMGAVTGMPEPRLAELCAQASTAREGVWIGTSQNAAQFVITGHRPAVARVLESAKREALRAAMLPISWPIHSPLMAPLTDALVADVPRLVAIADPRLPVHSPANGAPLRDAAEVRDLLTFQVVRPMRWERVVGRLHDDGIELYAQCGRDDQLSKMVRWLDREAQVEVIA
jgi:[acyl-carrier-protein] S-malonyltransferase